MNHGKMADTIKDATDKAGALVTASLVIASGALLVALAALVVAMKART